MDVGCDGFIYAGVYTKNPPNYASSTNGEEYVVHQSCVTVS